MRMKHSMFLNGILTIDIRGYIIKDRYFISSFCFGFILKQIKEVLRIFSPASELKHNKIYFTGGLCYV